MRGMTFPALHPPHSPDHMAHLHAGRLQLEGTVPFLGKSSHNACMYVLI